ncbi:MAG: DUF3800 domain-containing protein [Paracoccaceae bacterium]|nr:DUF3800 domain-containing protein [Paracoccaceae bacterium]
MSTRFVYFDEVKPNPKSFPDYLIAGFSVDQVGLCRLAEQFREIVSRRFAELGVPEGTEVHAQHIYHAKGDFKGKNIEARLGLLADILSLLAPEEIRLIQVRIIVDRLYNHESALEHAFMHFCERSHNTLGGAKVGMMIGDLDRATRNSLWKSFSDYRKKGTPWAFGRELPKFIDSVHFVDSRVCEMVQVADVFAFKCSDGEHRAGWPAEKFRELTKDIDLFPKSYKTWPPNR